MVARGGMKSLGHSGFKQHDSSACACELLDRRQGVNAPGETNTEPGRLQAMLFRSLVLTHR